MPQIIPRQFTAAPTNIQPGIGMAIGQGLQAVAGVAQQVEKGRREQDLLELKERERGERNAAINAMLEKQVWRQQYEYDVRQNHSPEEYLDALDKGESEYNESILAGKSEVFRDQFLNADKINRVQAMGVMGTTMQRDIMDNEKFDYDTAMDNAVKNAIATGNLDSIGIVSDNFLANGILKKGIIEKGEQLAYELVNQGIVQKMSPVERINFLDSISESGADFPGVDIAKEKARAVTEYNTEQSISAIQNNSSKMEVASGLASVFNNKTMNQQDAIDALDAMGMDKDSAPYIYGIGLIESQYNKKIGGMSAEEQFNTDLLVSQAESNIKTASQLITELSSDDSDLTDEQKWFRLRQVSDTLQDSYTQIFSAKIDSKKKTDLIVNLRDTNEKIRTGMAGIKGSSIASQAINTLNTIGSTRFFLSPVEQEIYRNTLMQAVNSHPQAYDVISDDDERTRAFRPLEFAANLEVGRYRGLVGTPEEIVKQVVEQTRIGANKTPEQIRASTTNAIASGMIPRPQDYDEAKQLAMLHLPANVTKDVIDAEVERIMSIPEPSNMFKRLAEPPDVGEVPKLSASEFGLEAEKSANSAIRSIESALTSVFGSIDSGIEFLGSDEFAAFIESIGGDIGGITTGSDFRLITESYLNQFRTGDE